jgi:pimeloyl-ACP methyl ester carboxylesterase
MPQYEWRKENMNYGGALYKTWVAFKLLVLYGLSGGIPIALLALAGFYYDYLHWTQQHTSWRQSNSNIFNGQLQYSHTCSGNVNNGKLEALYIHGVGAGFEEISIVDKNQFTDKQLCVVSVSRIGYPFSNKTNNNIDLFDESSQLFNDLIGHVFGNEASIHVVAVSGGGPFALHFVNRYPKRVKSLTLYGAIVREFNDVDLQGYGRTFVASTDNIADEPKVGDNEVYPLVPVKKSTTLVDSFVKQSNVSDFLAYVSTRLASVKPESIVHNLLEFGLTQQNEEQKRAYDQCVSYVSQHQKDVLIQLLTVHLHLNSERSKGKAQDMETFMNLPRDNHKQLENVQVPTLIVHSIWDKTVDFRSNALYAYQHIPNAQLEAVKGCGHVSVIFGTESSSIIQKIVEFASKNN